MDSPGSVDPFEDIRRKPPEDLEADVEYLPIPANGSSTWSHWLRPMPPEMVPFLAAPNTMTWQVNTGRVYHVREIAVKQVAFYQLLAE